jgi:PAS domain S-box-containing protein
MGAADRDSLHEIRQRIARLEDRLNAAAVPREAGTLRAVIDELKSVADGLRAQEYKLLALRGAFEVQQARSHSSEGRFENAFASAPIGMALVGTDGRTFQVNRALCEMLGYSEEEVLSGAVVDLATPDQIDYALRCSKELLRGERRSYQLEKRLRHKDGRAVTVLLSVSLFRGCAEHPPYFICQLVDISDRKRAERERRATEERFRALVENAFDVVSLLDAEGRLLYNSPNVARVFGYDPDAVVGRVTIAEGVHPDDVEGARRLFQDALRNPGRPLTSVHRVRRADGTWSWVEGTACNMLDNPHVRAIVVNTRDVTERKRVESAYQNLVEHSLQGLAIHQDGRIAFANRAVADMLGYTPEELMAMPAGEVNELLHPGDRDALLSYIRTAAATEPPPKYLELRVVRRDGSVGWLALAASRTEYRGRFAIQSAAIDITERKAAEEAARQRQAELAHVLRVNTMGEMAAGLAHEINQPLAAITNYAHGCVARLQRWHVPSEILGAIEQIAAEALRAGKIVRELRQFLRKEPARRQWEDLNAIVANAVRLMEGDARQCGVSINVSLEAQATRVKVDRVQIEQVIVNLVRNGIEAMNGGNGERRELSVRTWNGGDDHVVVDVRDDGSGIAPESGEKIFDPFFTTKPGGLGMGLAISRSILQAHDGRIWARPNDGCGGVTFSFAIPVARRVGSRSGAGFRL